MAKKEEQPIQEISKTDLKEVKGLLTDLIKNEQNKGESNNRNIHVLKLTLMIVESYLFLLNLLNHKSTRLKNLRRMLFGKTSEKSPKKDNEGGPSGQGNNGGQGGAPASPENGPFSPKNDGPQEGNDSDPSKLGKSPTSEGPGVPNGTGDDDKRKRKGGGGRNGSDSYTGAGVIHCQLCEGVCPGDKCPSCGTNKLYALPSITSVRLIGSAPVTAFKFIVERSGCACGAIFKGDPPEVYKDMFEESKYSPSSLSAIIHQKYDLGVPFGSLANLQKNVGVPLPATTQANKVKESQGPLLAVYSVLETLGANMDLVAFDDTKIKILEGRITREGKQSINGYGSVFVCNNIDDECKVVLYRFDFEHAGKYLLQLLKLREEGLPILNILCDGLPCYEPYIEKGVLANKCNVHSRRHFFLEDPEGKNFFCALIVSCYKIVFKNDKLCRENGLKAKERQEYHAKNSAAAMETILKVSQFMTSSPQSPQLGKLRLELGLPEYLIPSEPNSDLYRHAKYILDRYQELTNFTKIPGIPTDTNYVERKIKAIIEIRIRGLFFKTKESAIVAGKILSIIETAKENGVNSFEYVEFLLSHPELVMERPEDFLPWNYQAHRLFKVRQPLSTPYGKRPCQDFLAREGPKAP